MRLRVLGAALAAALAISSVALAAAMKTYTGTTTQQAPVKLKVPSNRKSVIITVRYAAACPDGSKISQSIHTSTALKNNRFKASGGGSSNSTGVETDKAYTIAGHFTSVHKAKGTLNVDIQKFDSNGTKTADCKTGTLRFTATH